MELGIKRNNGASIKEDVRQQTPLCFQKCEGLEKKVPTFQTQTNDSSFLGRDESKTLGQRINFRNMNHHTLPVTAVHNRSNLVTAHQN